jgi:Protein of unknown function (DUF4238)
MPKNLQHYVQEYYLGAFVDPTSGTNVWVYDKRTGQVRSQGIGGTAAEFYYYSLENPDGSKNDAIDRLVIDKVENAGVPILQRWRAEGRPSVQLSDLEPMARYLAVSYVRSPRARNDNKELMAAQARQMLLDIGRSNTQLEEFIAMNPDMHATKEKLREAIDVAQDPERMRLSPSGNFTVRSPFLFADEIAPPLVLMNWSFLESPQNVDFVTSDSPVSVYAVDARGYAHVGVGFGLRTAEITFPITPRVALRLAWREQPQYRTITERLAWNINRRAALQAHRQVYASKKSRRLLALVQEAAAGEPEHRVLSHGPLIQFRKVRHRRRGHR